MTQAALLVSDAVCDGRVACSQELSVTYSDVTHTSRDPRVRRQSRGTGHSPSHATAVSIPGWMTLSVTKEPVRACGCGAERQGASRNDARKGLE